MSPSGNAGGLRNRVRERRTAGGLTQYDLAQSAGLTRQSIIAIEKGRFTPSIATALALAAALGTTVDELFWLDEKNDLQGKR